MFTCSSKAKGGVRNRYDIEAIEGSFVDNHISDPTDLTFLIERMRELPEEARKYLTWAALFGETLVARYDLKA